MYTAIKIISGDNSTKPMDAPVKSNPRFHNGTGFIGADLTRIPFVGLGGRFMNWQGSNYWRGTVVWWGGDGLAVGDGLGYWLKNAIFDRRALRSSG